MTTPAVRLREVRKSFAVPGGGRLDAVDGVSLEIAPASMVALTGPSGSGKSTLLHLVGAIERLDSGTIEVDGRSIGALSGAALAAHRRGVGLVFQRFHLLPALSVLDNVIVPVLPFRTDFDKAQRARELLGVVGLADRAGSLASRLSGGQQQRVAIARALINAPRLLLADEPTGNLDSEAGTAVIDLLRRVREERGTTVLVATHDAAIARRCDRVLRLHDGRLVGDDDVPAEVLPPRQAELPARP